MYGALIDIKGVTMGINMCGLSNRIYICSLNSLILGILAGLICGLPKVFLIAPIIFLVSMNGSYAQRLNDEQAKKGKL